MMRTATIIGSTGLIGRHCLEVLLADPAYERVIALSRRPSGIRHPKLQEETMNFDALVGLPARHCDAAFCALGSTLARAGSKAAFRRIDYDYVEAFARWAHARGAQSFALVSSIGADPASGNFYLRTKGETEQAVERAGFRDTHVFRPSILVGDRVESRFAESVGVLVMRAVQFALVGSLRKYRPVDALNVARAMVAACAAPSPGTHLYEYPDILRLSGRP